MTQRLREALRDHAASYRLQTYGEGERSPWVFHHLTARRHYVAGGRIKNPRRSFQGALKRAGLNPGVWQHDLRHRRVTTWLAEGQPVHIVQKALGHADIKTTLWYYRFVDDDLLQLVDRPHAGPHAASG